MATFEMVECLNGGIDGPRVKCKTTQQMYPAELAVLPNPSWLKRAFGFLGSGASATAEQTTNEACASTFGLGSTSLKAPSGRNNCALPCPPSYLISTTDPRYCEPRGLLTALDQYFLDLKDASKNCADKSASYQKAVAESGQDPLALAFDDACSNPYKCDDKVEEIIDGKTLGESGKLVKGSDGTWKPPPIPPQNSNDSWQCKGGFYQPWIPPPPKETQQLDSSGGDGEPLSRITLTDEEIDALPKEKFIGTETDGDLAVKLRRNPTFCDVHPEYLLQCVQYIPNFTWCCVPTLEEFDKLPESFQCLLGEDYFTIYDDPSIIRKLRETVPTITITRDGRPATKPDYPSPLAKMKSECAKREVTQAEADGKMKSYGTCSWQGDCKGYCKCPEPPPVCNKGSTVTGEAFCDIDEEDYWAHRLDGTSGDDDWWDKYKWYIYGGLGLALVGGIGIIYLKNSGGGEGEGGGTGGGSGKVIKISLG
jgi:hypothetical protein